jgi:hypothetical protein
MDVRGRNDDPVGRVTVKLGGQESELRRARHRFPKPLVQMGRGALPYRVAAAKASRRDHFRERAWPRFCRASE